MNHSLERLSLDIYRTILKYSPIPTVDFIVVRKKTDGCHEFLLGKRNEEPYRGRWFVPGGRIAKEERLEDALLRHAKRELGITPQQYAFLGCQDVINPPRFGIRWHSIWHIYLVDMPLNFELRCNRENARIKWFSRINHSWPSPVKRALEKAGFSY